MALKVQFEIGHTSKLRSKKTAEGFTHDWELYVKGVNEADISCFVDKVVFNLHESFPKPKRVCKEYPYMIQESGYAGFMLPIDIYFRNRDEPKRVQFNYDLDLQQHGPPHHRCDVQKYIFDNPSEEFRQKLLKGGGIPVAGVIGGSMPTISLENHKSPVVERKNYKSRLDDAKLNTFANVFGTPITKINTIPTLPKSSPDRKQTAHSIQNISKLNTNLSNSSASNANKDKSCRDKDRILSSAEKNKDRSERKDKLYKQTPNLNSYKDGKSDSKKTENSKYERRDKSDEKMKKDKSREKDRPRSRQSSMVNPTVNLVSGPAGSAQLSQQASLPKRSNSPKREQSPLKTSQSAISGSNNAQGQKLPIAPSQRPPSSNNNRIDGEQKSKCSKDNNPDNKLKDPKIKESSTSSSGGKKSKKDKKDKEKERRYEDKEKQKHIDGLAKPLYNSNLTQSGVSSPKLFTNSENKTSKTSTNADDYSKNREKASKPLDVKPAEKTSGKALNSPTISNTATGALEKTKSTNGNSSINSTGTSEKDRRSHKHKKKEKSKDKDRERDKEKDREKEKDRDKDKDNRKEVKDKIDKSKDDKALDSTLQMGLTNNLISSPITNPSIEETVNTSSSGSSSALSTSISSSKKSPNKVKKSKDKPIKDDRVKHKLQNTDPVASKSKQMKLISNQSNEHIAVSSSTSAITNANSVASINFELSDDTLSSSSPNEPSLQSNLMKSKTHLINSDSSSSSFPDFPQKASSSSSNKATPESSKIVSPIPSNTNNATVQSNKDAQNLSKIGREKTDKILKDEKKRKHNAPENTFIEPPTKHLKKDQSKNARDKSKSPSIRHCSARSNGPDSCNTFLQPGTSPSSALAAAAAATPLQAATNHSTTLTENTPVLSAAEAVGNAISATANAATSVHSSSANNKPTESSLSPATAPTPPIPSAASSSSTSQALPIDYLSELQELHHKIMTLEDGEDLQHVVEVIAATGCYEITTKTFDFDLCKLDRSTVQRLQEYFATSVS